ncbi:hypothetical protein P43SY_008901 [Pythium insidiosum]|uniref:Ricin B lectin domain-containing protein n=1 Tax=Pythium insidiosum TaxID=114742 RepID=A0AAD5M6S2_PYTIN|nr:hypothetical protein P43SY_008901 [Pythium insidiosum]
MRSPLPKWLTAAAAAVTVALSLAMPGASAATDTLRVGAWLNGSNCIDHAWNTDYAYVYRCHGDPNQQWELTPDGLIRSAQGNCLEFSLDNDNVRVVRCDAARPQRWYVVDRLIKPQAVWSTTANRFKMRLGMCLEAANPNGRLALYRCHGAPTQQFTSAALPTNLADIVAVPNPSRWPAGDDCLDYDVNRGVAVVYACHGRPNQRWEFTANDELRVQGDKCLAFDLAQQSRVVVQRCSDDPVQKWIVRSDGAVVPKGFLAANGSFVGLTGQCLQPSASLPFGQLELGDCLVSGLDQRFVSGALRPRQQAVIKVDGPWADGANCVDYDFNQGVAYVFSCHGLPNQIWELTPTHQLRSLRDDACLELARNGQDVAVLKCDATRDRQRWRRATDNVHVSPLGFRDGNATTATRSWRRADDRCLAASTGPGSRLQVETCADKPTQKFRSRALGSVRGLLYAEAARTDSDDRCVSTESGSGQLVLSPCDAAAIDAWEVSRDGEIRPSAAQCLSALVKNGSVRAAPCDGSLAQRWRVTSAGHIVARAGVSLSNGTGLCLDAAVSSSSLALSPCSSDARSQVFSSSVFRGVATGSKLEERLGQLVDAATEDRMLSPSVFSRAADVVAQWRELGETPPADAVAILRQAVFQTTNASAYRAPARLLYATTETKEFVVLAALVFEAAHPSAPAPTLLKALDPLLSALSEQLWVARHDALQEIVLSGDLGLVEAFVDGTLGDFGALGGTLSALCRATNAGWTMCHLATYTRFLDGFFLLRRRVAVEGAAGLQPSTLTLGRELVQLFSTSHALLFDPLWHRTMALVLVRAPFVGVLPAETLARAMAPDAYLSTFVLYAGFPPNGVALDRYDAHVRLLSDQIAALHYNAILRLATDKDWAALDAYVSPPVIADLALVAPVSNGSAPAASDFFTIVQHVAPLLCGEEDGDPTQPSASTGARLSLCKLRELHTGLQAMLRFERERRSAVVRLDDVLEVDVRRKLDVIDQEKKQFEVLATLQDVANRIGAAIAASLATLQQEMRTSTTKVLAAIDATRADLRQTIGAVGRQLQDDISASTTRLYDEVGRQAAAIRADVTESARRLETRLDDTGRALLSSIEQSRQELKYQIGAEAQRTRELVDQKSQQLAQHISNEAGGLRQFIDAKTNQVIGAVREEGASTRVYMDQKTKEIVGVVRDESAQTRAVVREESRNIQKHIDVKTNEIVGVVREEGRATRDHITQKTIELKEHVTSEANGIKSKVDAAWKDIANGIKSKVDAAWKDIVATSNNHFEQLMDAEDKTQSQLANSTRAIIANNREGVKRLAQRYKASCVTADAAWKEFRDAADKEFRTENDISIIGPQTINFLNELIEKSRDAFAAAWPSFIWRGMFLLVKTAVDVRVRSQRSNIATDIAEIDDLATEISQHVAAQGRLRDVARKLKSVAEDLKTVSNELAGNGPSPQLWALFNQLLKANVPPATIAKFANEMDRCFKLIRRATLADVSGDMQFIMTMACDALQELRDSGSYFAADDAATAIQFCYLSGKSIQDIGALLQNAAGNIDRMRVHFGKLATAQMECTKAAAVENWADGKKKKSSRALQQSGDAVTIDSPFEAMHYTALARLLLDYQLQEAGYQFCKFYEFRNGGVAPPMCGDGTYYTLEQILLMRTWRPPVYKRSNVRALLPTRPTSPTAAFVDLDALRRGRTAFFKLPLTNLDWLKKYGWISRVTTPDDLPSIYVDSIRVYLPIVDNSSSATVGGNSLAVAVHAESSRQQLLHPSLPSRTYELPPQTFVFDATYGDSACANANRLVNPYHRAAGCVQDDGSSDLCMRESGRASTQDEHGLLPSLFSTWRVRVDLETTAGPLQFVAPDTSKSYNGTTPEFNVLVDLSVIQVGRQGARDAATFDARESAAAAAGSLIDETLQRRDTDSDNEEPLLYVGLNSWWLKVSLSAFAFLFSEMVQYFQGRVQNITDLETRLDDAGFGVGVRVLELLCFREKSGRRETRLINMLQFVVSTCWKALFGKAADALERSTENEDEYMIHELEPLTNKFISVPQDLGQLDCAAFIAGMIRGILTSGGFPAQVTAHAVETGAGQRDKTVFLVKFDEVVIRRERVFA